MALNYKSLTDAEIAAALSASVCVMCDRPKPSAQPFCPTDYAALSLPSRLALADPARRIEAFRSACCHLDLNRTRRREMNAWPHTSDDDLYAAGYKWRAHKLCEAPGCGKRISIWITPAGALMALDRFTRQPHRNDCADPDYFRRLREQREERKRLARLQTSARRKRA